MTTGGIFGGATIGAWGAALLRALAMPRFGQYTGLSFDPRRLAEAG